jgi:hypothetical protein
VFAVFSSKLGQHMRVRKIEYRAYAKLQKIEQKREGKNLKNNFYARFEKKKQKI